MAIFEPLYRVNTTTFRGFQLAFLPQKTITYPVLEKLGYVLMFFVIFFLSVVFIEPSPHDVLAPLALLLWLVIGLTFSRYMVFFIGTLLLYNIGGFIGLIPYFSEPDSVLFMFQSFYLAIMALFYTLFFFEKTAERLQLVLRAYVISCIFAALTGIIGYFDIFGLGESFTRYGRASAMFKDPNVFGSFLTPSALYLLFNLLIGRTRNTFLSAIALFIIMAGIFLSFSRGSWGGSVVAVSAMFFLTYITTQSRQTRRRIGVIGLISIIGASFSLIALISIPEVREMLEVRASVTQDYDEGHTGRFGNQIRSIPMLLEEPNGLGPLRFRRFFGIEPHNTYINAFASYGWLGGFAFLTLAISTLFVGFRLCLRPSPFQPYALIIVPAGLMYFLQAMQIDIDHWRHFYLILGMIWGMEAARRKWHETEYQKQAILASPVD